MSQNQSDRQIKQMVNFIMQEAHEKVNELRIKVNNVYLLLFSFALFRHELIKKILSKLIS